MKGFVYCILGLWSIFIFSCHHDVHVGDGLVRIPVYENELKLVNLHEGDTVSAIYGFSILEKQLNERAGDMMFGIHLYQENRIEEVLMQIMITDEHGKVVVKNNYTKPNYPISIGRPSVYQCVFPYKAKAVYRVLVHFPDGDLEDLSIDFQYPLQRI